ncbi:MAG: nitrate reductase, partial [Gammaproteobacteria bacterium]|nr:nitrate reductase [Gammaproteobacteria bacterium]NIR93679.1 nitrate reductase [Gammaproteobacteria bacterium]NIX02217.1 nitrate reductase [Phycisphaerae bacterium]
QTINDWPRWARAQLCTSDHDINWIEYLDRAAMQYRGARLIDRKLESCIFISPDQTLPSRTWLAGLFEKNSIDDHERNGLLTGEAVGEIIDNGPVVCACFNVGLNTLKDAIESKNLLSVEEIGRTLKAGTNCGSCIPELRALLTGK